MKDKHNIILILLSLSGSIPSFGGFSWWLLSRLWVNLFYPGVQSFLGHLVRTSIKIIARLNPYSFHPSILSRHPLLPEFFMVARHDLIHSSRVHQDSNLRSSSILLLASRGAINSPYSFEVEFCISSFFSAFQFFSACGRLSPHNFWEVVHKSITSLFFSLLIFSTIPFNRSS